MKKWIATSSMLLAMLTGFWPVFAQEKITVTASAPDAANGLDLTAVGQLFKSSTNLEVFERALNDPDAGVNNLDLDGDGNVDFIRVVEETVEGVHLIILQVPLAENEFQDVATIEVERTGEDRYIMQVHGNDFIYGTDYYVTASDIRIHRWPIIAMIYRPVYRPYRSMFHFGYYPNWWRPRVPLAVHAYRSRTVKIADRNVFTVARKTRVTGAARVHYVPRSSTHFRHDVKAVRPAGENVHVKKNTDKPARIKHERAGETPHKGGTREKPDRRH
jgi:hypothetical protein